MILLSGSGMLRTILVLIIVWLILRAYLRSQQRTNAPRGTHFSQADQRAKGEVRIERPDAGKRMHQGPVEDADFEEIK
jgi:hypothetical protein